jgi:hypothetical protein
MPAVHRTGKHETSRILDLRKAGLSLLLFLAAVALPCVAQEREDLDEYTIRFQGFWFYSVPSGSFHGTGSQGSLDLQRDINFNSYSTGASLIDFKFTRKNHLTLRLVPVNQTKDLVLNRTVFFQGQTFAAGLAASGRLQSYLVAPGYRYDIIRRRRGHVGVIAQLDLFYVRGSINATAQTLNGMTFTGQRASSTLRAPLPVAGPDVRYYLTNSRRLFVDANLLGMYFFGYGNFVSSTGTLGFALNRYLNFQGGYSLGSRFDIQSSTNRIGLTLAQHGAIAGVEVSF